VDAENPTATPDGQWIIYGSANPAHSGIWKIRADGTVVPFEIKLKNGQSAGRARRLPDGRGLAFIAPDEHGVNGVWAQDFAADRDTTATRRRLSEFSSKAVTESFSIARDGTRITIAETETLSSLMIADRVSDLSPAK
jgi:hypothetical protein